MSDTTAARVRSDGTGTPPLIAQPRARELPLSYAQERFWIVEQLFDTHGAYNTASAVQLLGRLNVAALTEALTRIVARQEVLRCRFVKTVDGTPVQIISEQLPPDWLSCIERSALDAQAFDQLLERTLWGPYDLTRGPLIRALLVRRAADRHTLFIAMHHLVCDGWSVSILIDELCACYAALARDQAVELPALSVQYADYAVWQRQCFEQGAMSAHIEYWKRQLAGARTTLELPTRRQRPAVQSFHGAFFAIDFPKRLIDTLRRHAAAEKATLFMLIAGALAVLLSRWAGCREVIIGVPSAGRQLRALETLIGFFVNTLPLRVMPSVELSFRELLAQVRNTALDAYAHESVPFEKISEVLRPQGDLGRPSYEVVFDWHNEPQPRVEVDGLRLDVDHLRSATSKADFMLDLTETADGVSGGIEYATELFEESTIAQLADSLLSILEAVAREPSAPLATLDLGTDIAVPAARRERDETAAEVASSMHADRAHDSQPAVSTARTVTLSGTALEQRLSEIWGDVLRVAWIKPQDNFFDLGGQSIIGVRLLARVYRELGIELPLRFLFSYPTLGQMSTYLQTLATVRAAGDAVTAGTKLAGTARVDASGNSSIGRT